jgi:integrase/recombinase XerD
MSRLPLRYVVDDVDRHGNRRFYFRRRTKECPNAPKIRLPGLPGSTEFMSAYQQALLGQDQRPPKRAFNRPGTFRFLCNAYYASPVFKALNRGTQDWRRRVLDGICLVHGDSPMSGLKARHIRKLRDEKSETPSASENRLKALRAVLRWGVDEEIIDDDPTVGIKPLRYHSDGHHCWTKDEVKTFEDRHPIGSQARLAMALMIYTACRIGDVVLLGPQHIRGGRLQYRQAKNALRKPADMDIPVFAELAEIISASPINDLTFLITEYGKPFTTKGFGNKFRDYCNQAGLPNCTAHGLRKAAATWLAECGATTHEIMAITGHRSVREVQRYTDAANKVLLADAGMTKLKSRT